MKALQKLYKKVTRLHAFKRRCWFAYFQNVGEYFKMNIYQTRDIIIVKKGWKLLEKFKCFCNLCATKVNYNLEITSVRSSLDLGHKFELENYLST